MDWQAFSMSRPKASGILPSRNKQIQPLRIKIEIWTIQLEHHHLKITAYASWSNNNTQTTVYVLYLSSHSTLVVGAVASWLVCSTPECAVQVWALDGDIVLCSWARHFTLTVPLSTQVYKWVPANCWGNLTNCGEVTCDGLASRAGK